MGTDATPDAQSPLGVIAGRGPLPFAVADDALRRGRRVFIVGVEGTSDPAIARYPHGWVKVGALGHLVKLLKEAGCQDIVMIGPMDRPDLSKIKPDWLGIKQLPRFLKLMRQGDDGLLRGIIEFLEKDQGFHVVAAHDVSTSLVAPEGCLTDRSPSPENQSDIDRAAEAVRLLGRLDIGQGAVACRGLILALEAAEGTDAMLRRVAGLDPALRGTGERREGVLVKLPKPQQERRADLPTIGATTVELAADAGLAGIAVEAGGAILFERDKAVARANELGMFLVGLPAPAPAPE